MNINEPEIASDDNGSFATRHIHNAETKQIQTLSRVEWGKKKRTTTIK